MPSVTLPPLTVVTLDAGTDNSLSVLNTGLETCTIRPSGQKLRPGQLTTVTVQPGTPVTAESRFGSSITYTVGSESQPGTPGSHIIDGGSP